MRRSLLPLALCLPLTRQAWAQPIPTEPQDDQPQALLHYTVSAAHLQAGVAQRFSMRYPAAGLTISFETTPL